jgi:hypothetical protein
VRELYEQILVRVRAVAQRVRDRLERLRADFPEDESLAAQAHEPEITPITDPPIPDEGVIDETDPAPT